jgi:hexosaminidase
LLRNASHKGSSGLLRGWRIFSIPDYTLRQKKEKKKMLSGAYFIVSKRFNRKRGRARAYVLMAILGALNAGSLLAQQPTLNVMPMPANVQLGSGELVIDANFSIALTGYTEPRLTRSVQRFRRQLARETGLVLPHETQADLKAETAKTAPPAGTLTIHTGHASQPIQELGEDESYTLEVTNSGAKLNAETPLGTMHGLQTFLQLVAVTPQGFAAPAVTIHDKPRFPWRGLMIDVGRHFMPIEVLQRNIDGMEAVKMNVFHWHLSENQGFRVESKKFPKLHEMGSDGLYYTQEEVRGLIEYARDRGIRVVPEFDVPGHSTAWLVGYPEFASGPGPYEIERRWGVFDPAFDPTSEKTYKFLSEFFEEMAKLFPDHFFHVGGDEVNGKEWDGNPKIQLFIRANHLKNNQSLQAYFNKRLQAIIAKHGKSMVGWDEVLTPDLPRDIVIQSWRGQDSLAAAAKQGFRGILSSGYYLDLGLSAARHYTVDPMSGAAALSPEEQQRILGGESCMWSEYVNAENVDSRIWPRNAAIAERLWSPQNVTDVASMYARMDAESARLEWLGLTHKTYYQQMLQRIAGPATPQESAALRTLADVVEPVKDYARGQLAATEPTSATPLQRMVDAVSPESDESRRFGILVDKYLAGSCKDDDTGAELRAELTHWRDNDAAFESLQQKSFLAKELAPVSQDLATLGKIGVAAMDYLILGSQAPNSWKTDQSALLAEVSKPKAQLLLIPVSSVQKFVDAASGGAACANK